MQDKKLLLELLECEFEDDAIVVLHRHGLFEARNDKRWIPLGKMPNNQSVVHAQQSSAAAALVEKLTNGLDAILLRRCKVDGVDPRSTAAPRTMSKAVQRWFGDLGEKSTAEIRQIAEENLVLYATGSKARPCLSFYDAGEGQLPQNFPATFCSLIYGSDEGSYKGAVPFVQGRFNMGGTGVLPFCGDDRKMQLIVSRVPSDVVKSPHEWGFTIFCYFASRQSPSWKYLVGPSPNEPSNLAGRRAQSRSLVRRRAREITRAFVRAPRLGLPVGRRHWPQPEIRRDAENGRLNSRGCTARRALPRCPSGWPP